MTLLIVVQKKHRPYRFLTRILLSIIFVLIINTSSNSGTGGRGGGRGIFCQALVLGAVGGVTETSAIVAFRTDDTAISHVQVQYSTDPSFAASRTSSSVSTDSSTDYTGQITLNGLQSDTIYYYRIVENGTTIQSSPYTQQFQTFPSPGSVVTFVVFADAANNDRPAQSYISAATGDNPLFAMQIGDFDHSDPQGLTAHRTMHKRMRDYTSRTHGAQFAQYVLTKMCFIHIWDDHDYCGQDTNKDCELKTEHTQAFREYYPTYPEANPTDGIYHKFVAGNAEIFVLDTRSQRDPGTNNDDDNKSMLGSTQRIWLLEGLRDSQSHWKIVISSSGANREARAGTSIDNWTAYQNEANLVSQYILDHGITNIVMISGDIHTGGGIDNGINNLWGIPEVTVPHTNLARGNSANLGIWSQGVYSGGDGENGEGYVRVTISSDNNLVLTTLDRNGNERISWQYDSDTVGGSSTTTPTEPPTCAPSCFSGIATVQVLVGDHNNNNNTTPTTTRTTTLLPMDQLKVGDYVQIANGNYQPIYAFAHRDPTFRKTDFLQIFFRLINDNNNNPRNREEEEEEESSLEVSSEHLIYVVQQQQQQGNNKGNNHHHNPIPARSIKVGDKLLTRIPLAPQPIPQQIGGGSTTTTVAAAAAVTVLRIKRISRTGLYAPLTVDGTIVVNGIVSSCYVSLQQTHNSSGKHHDETADDDDGFVHLSTGVSLMGLSQHFLIHMTLSPLRIVCTTTIMNMIGKKRFCCGEWQHHQDEGGDPTMVIMNDFVALGLTFADWIQVKSWPIQLAFLVLHFMIFGSCLMVEWVFLRTNLLVNVAFLLGLFILLILYNKRHELRIDALYHGCICRWVPSLTEVSSTKQPTLC